MESNLDFDVVLQRVTKINEDLRDKNMDLKAIEAFWNKVFKQHRINVVMAMFFKGKNDREISKITGFSLFVISKVTTGYFKKNEPKINN